MKKSLQVKIREARTFSAEHLSTKVWVLDKKGERATITSVPWVRIDLIQEGWMPVTAFVDGKEVECDGD